MENGIKDSCGFLWIWDGRRIYLWDAEKEMVENDINPVGNGYQARSFEGAVKLLKEYGYIEE
jgi:hypothetical protein